jgi:ribonuclease HI
MKHIELIADGSCLRSPGPGGWACILRYQGIERILSGGSPITTSNQMELRAVTMGLRALQEPCDVCAYTDSKYVQQGMTTLWKLWNSRALLNSRGRPLANRRLWLQLHLEAQRHRIHWQWVKGHSNHQDHNRCDVLARQAARLISETAA